MANIIKKLFGLQETNQFTKAKELEKFRLYGENYIEVVPESKYPEHLIAHGKVMRDEKQLFSIRTAISKRGSNIELSTNVGQVQNSPFGQAVQARLNYQLEDGKLNAFNNHKEPDKMDLIYTSKKPEELLNRQRFEQELKHHALVKEVVSPILDASLKIGEPKKNLDYPKLQGMAQDFVDSNLKLQSRLSNKLTSGKYLPDPQSKKIE